jgi:prepilin-type N-terminal cleavage/methylation domain-containing protein
MPKIVNFISQLLITEVGFMKDVKQQGFSLIEILVVITVLGIVSVLSIPLYKKAINASENMSIFTTAKFMVQEQTAFFTTNSRYARLDELNAQYNNNFGKYQDNTIVKGKFTITMSPVAPTDSELRTNYTIIATRTLDSAELPYVISFDASGEVIQIIP